MSVLCVVKRHEDPAASQSQPSRGKMNAQYGEQQAAAQGEKTHERAQERHEADRGHG